MEAIRKFLDGQADGQHLLYALMRHPEWRVPLQDVPEEAEMALGPEEDLRLRALEDPEGKLHFNIYSSAEALLAALQKLGPEAVGTRHLVMPGWVLFSFESDAFAYLNIDPETPTAIHYKQDQFERLRNWARIVALDEVLNRVQLEPEVTEQDRLALLEYAHYFIVAVQDADGEPRLALAPDTQGRMLGAVFTARLAADAYLENLMPTLEPGTGVQTLQLDGLQLYTELAQMPLQGIVFNCSGPLRPRALSARLAQFVLGQAE